MQHFGWLDVSILHLTMLNYIQDTTKQNTGWMTMTTGDMIPLTLQSWQFSFFFKSIGSYCECQWCMCKGVPQEPQLEFWWKFALALMEHTLNEEGKVVIDLSPATRRSMVQKISIEHNLVTKDPHCSTWKNGKWTWVKDTFPKQWWKICYNAKV